MSRLTTFACFRYSYDIDPALHGETDECHDETAFLMRLLSYDDRVESRQVEAGIARIQSHQACVLKAAWTAGLPGVLSAFLSQIEFFQSGPPIRLRILCVLAIAGLICVLTFVVSLLIYRAKLNELRQQSRELISQLALRRLAAGADTAGL